MSLRKMPIAAGAFFFAAALPLLAAPDFPDGKWWRRPMVAREIELSDDQSREIEKIFVAARTRLIDLRGDLEKKQLALQSSMEDQGADRKTVEKQIETVENARAELQKARALMVLDMKQLLKPAQWDRLLQMHQEFRQRRQNMRQQDRQSMRPEGRGGRRPR